MARFIPKQFAENSTTSVVFGSFQEQGGNVGDGTISSDPATLQGGTAWPLGWKAATDNFFQIPRGEEMEGLERVLSAAIIQQFTDGLTFWQPEMPVTQYQTIVQYQTGSDLPKLYINITGNSTSTPPDSDTTNWKEMSFFSRNIGEIVTSSVPLTDAGLHLADGSLISGSGSYAGFVTYMAGLVSTYPDLFDTEANWQSSVSTYGVCGKYVYDSVNNTIRLPKIEGFIEGTLDPTKLGDLVEAGLPNITGYTNYGLFSNNASPTGCFTQTAQSVSASSAVGTDGWRAQIFDASRSNPVYGNSTTVQPQSTKVFYYVVIATSTKTAIEVDIDEIATDLNGKADVDLSNLTATGEAHFAKPNFSNATKPYVTETYHSGTTWHIVFSDGFKMQGGVIGSLAVGASTTVYFSKPFSETNYFCCPSWSSASYGGMGWTGRSTTGMTIQNASGSAATIYWMACGY